MTIAVAIPLVVSALSASAGTADLDAVDREVALFTGAGIGTPGGAVRPVDKRLRLNPCQSGLSLVWRTARRDTVTVSCSDPGGWRLFVPVMAAPSAAVDAPAATAVQRGDAVSLSVSGQGFTVSRPAEALEAGGAGEWIRVRPVTERRMAEEPVRARIVRPGLVTIPAS